MWIVVVKYSVNNEIFLFKTLEEATNKYNKVVESGRVAYLTELIKTNV